MTLACAAVIHGIAPLTSGDLYQFQSWLSGSLAILAGIALLIGFLTPFAGVGTAGYFGMEVAQRIFMHAHEHSNSALDLCLGVIALALVLLGPGAYSLDARLFGRREIIIRDVRRSSD